MILQHSLFNAPAPASALTCSEQTFRLTGTVKSPHSGSFEVDVVRITVAPNEGRWMWSTSIKSVRGFHKGYACLPKWGNFTHCKRAAIDAAIDELIPELGNLSELERDKAAEWLSELSSSMCAAEQGSTH